MKQERPYLFERSEGSRNSNTYEIEIRERIVRVHRNSVEVSIYHLLAYFVSLVRAEEELKHQRELMIEGFKMMDKRFETMQISFHERFEDMQKQMDSRFDLMDKRFDIVDKRFDALTKRIDRFMIWSFAMMLSIAGVAVTISKLIR